MSADNTQVEKVLKKNSIVSKINASILGNKNIPADKTPDYLVLNWVIIILSVLTFSNFLLTGFATSDDFEYFLVSHDQNIWNYSARYAKMNGRFYYLFMHPVFNIITPNILPPLINQFFKVFITYSNIILMAIIIKQLTDKIIYPYFFILITLIFINIKSYDNPIVSYSFYFTLSFSILLLSILFYINYLNKGKSIWLVMSLVLYTFALLFYENYLLYIPAFFFIAVYLNKNEGQRIISLLIKQKELLLFGLIATVYITVYIIFKNFYATPVYNGVTLANEFSISAIANTVTTITKGAYPLHNYFTQVGLYHTFSYINEGHVQSILNPVIHIKTPWLIKSVLVGLVTYLLLTRFPAHKLYISKKNTIAILFIILLIYIPQFLISLTVKYQHHASIGMQSYVTTYYSTYPFYILLSLLFLFIWHKLQGRFQTIVKYIIIAILALCSILTDYANFHASEDLKNVYRHFEAMNAFMQSESMKTIPDNSTIIAPELFSYRSYVSYYNTIDTVWTSYFKVKLKKNIRILQNDSLANFSSAIPNIYYLSYSKNKREDDQFFVFGKILKKQNEPLQYCSDNISMYVFSPSKELSVLLPKENIGNQKDSIIINNSTIVFADQNCFKAHLLYKDRTSFFKEIKIQGSALDPRHVIVYINTFDSDKIIDI